MRIEKGLSLPGISHPPCMSYENGRQDGFDTDNRFVPGSSQFSDHERKKRVKGRSVIFRTETPGIFPSGIPDRIKREAPVRGSSAREP
jgi:hypothetical protein